MEVPGNVSRKAKREWQHGKLAQNTIAAQKLHVCNGPGEHGLHQAEGILRDVFKKRSGEGVEKIKVVDEFDFKVCLRAGLDQCSAPAQSGAKSSSHVVPFCVVWSTMGSTLMLCQKMRTIIRATACGSSN